MSVLSVLQQRWHQAWPRALAVWGRYTRLREPVWCLNQADAVREQLSGSFAMIRLEDLVIDIGLDQVHREKIDRYAVEVLAHEVGHHICYPGNLTDHARSIARVRRSLPTLEQEAPLVANLYTDLLINDRLQRSAGLDMAGVFRTLGGSGGAQSRMWTFYMRIYEILWSLTRGALALGTVDDVLEGDAQLGARLIRVYAHEWLDGAGRFAALCLPYLLDDAKGMREILGAWLDTENAGAGGTDAGGLTEIDLEELEGALHPSEDEALAGLDAPATEAPSTRDHTLRRDFGGGMKEERIFRDPMEYGEILRAAGMRLDAGEIAARYYRERALPYLIRFPVRELPQATDPLPEGTEPWHVAAAMDEVDWLESVMVSPAIVPGVTTVKRTWGASPGGEPAQEPVDLYIGIDCSGSMGNPRMSLSYPVLAGVIVTLSALRAGARVMACLSGEPGRTIATDGFVGNEREVLAILTDYLGTGFGFGMHHLGPVFDKRRPEGRACHILIVTDGDVFAMLADRQKKRDGWEVARTAAAQARGGATYVLNIPPRYHQEELVRMQTDGWDVHHIRLWEDLIAFAQAFASKTYEHGRDKMRKR